MNEISQWEFIDKPRTRDEVIALLETLLGAALRREIEEGSGEQGLYTVWVGGTEINDHFVAQNKAKAIAQVWIEKGYEDVAIVRIDDPIKEDNRSSD